LKGTELIFGKYSYEKQQQNRKINKRWFRVAKGPFSEYSNLSPTVRIMLP